MIEAHIDQDRWGRLKEVERLERQTVLDRVGIWKVEKPNQGFGF